LLFKKVFLQFLCFLPRRPLRFFISASCCLIIALTIAKPLLAQHGTDSAMLQLDMIDVVQGIGKGHIEPRGEGGISRRLRISAVPAVGYTLQTGLAVIAAGNATFYTDSTSKQSVISTSIAYTQYHQVIAPIMAEIWSGNNAWHLSVDWRYMKYPSLTFGLGMRSQLNEGYTLDYSAIRLHQIMFRRIDGGKIYLGLGWTYDYFWNIREVDTPDGIKITSFARYDSRPTEVASGPVLAALWDTRDNPINAHKGGFVRMEFQTHPQWASTDPAWNAFILDARKYVTFPAQSNNVLAFWTYDWFTKRGAPPYLLLPNTGGDPASNTGRGYIQGRYRGNNFIYLEGEYRMQLTSNGLFGAVVFCNAQSVTRTGIRDVSVIAPGYGAGLRIKLNKFSGTNLSVDYGFGIGGSHGLFVNLGEVF
jgi:hypothetical protein